jgi:hypothetical protein
MKLDRYLCSVFAAALVLIPVGGEVVVSLEMSGDGESWSSIAPGDQAVSGSAAYFRAAVAPSGGGTAVPTSPVSIDLPSGSGTVNVVLNRSTDLSDWTATTPGTQALNPRAFFNVEANLLTGWPLIPAGSFIMGE